jgi:WD40 repeat protein
MKYFLLSTILTWAASLAAQNTGNFRYADMRAEGIALIDKKNYKDAINIFWSALIVCKDKPENHDLNEQRLRAQSLWERELRDAVAREQAAYREALAAKNTAETAKLAEEQARKLAEQNARKAHEQGKRAESLRLSLLADMARQRGRKTEALLLSWMALQLAGPDLSTHIMRSFGEAVLDTFAQTCFKGEKTIRSVRYLPGGHKILIETSEPLFFIARADGTPGVTQLPQGLREVAPSASGAWLAAWGTDNDVRILDDNGAVRFTLSGHSEPVRFVVFSPDGTRILTCSRDNTARLWDMQGKAIAVLYGHIANVQSAAFSPDGSFLVTRSVDGTARIWNKEGVLSGVCAEPDVFLKSVTIQSQRVVALSGEGRLKVYTLDGQPVTVPDMSALKEIVTAGENGIMAVRNSSEAAIIDEQGTISGRIRHNTPLTGMFLHPSGKWLLTWTKDRVVRLWDGQGGLKSEFPGHRSDIVSASLSADTRYVLTTTADGVVRLWDTTGNMLTEWRPGNSSPGPALFSPDGRNFLTAGNDSKTVSIAPFPQDVYNQVAPTSVLGAESTADVLRKYDVQYVEELGGKH